MCRVHLGVWTKQIVIQFEGDGNAHFVAIVNTTINRMEGQRLKPHSFHCSGLLQ